MVTLAQHVSNHAISLRSAFYSFVNHPSWNTMEFLKDFKGFKKVLNFQKLLMEDAEWRKNASAEFIEQADVALELRRDMYNEWRKVERIVASRYA